MYKIIYVLVLLFSVSSFAQTHFCDDRAVGEGFNFYKEACGGYGGINACEARLNPKSGNPLKYHAKCSFIDVEADYLEFFEAEIMLDPNTCHVVSRKLIQCEQN